MKLQNCQIKFWHPNQRSGSRTLNSHSLWLYKLAKILRMKIYLHPLIPNAAITTWGNSLYSLSFKDIPELIVEKIKDFFAWGLSPAAAYRELLRQFTSESKDELDYHKKLTDRSQAPMLKDFRDIYTGFKKEKFDVKAYQLYFQFLRTMFWHFKSLMKPLTSHLLILL